MSGRTYRSGLTQGIEHVDYCFTIVGAGAATPTLSEGDPNGAYVTLGRTGVGVYTIQSKDPFPAIVATGFQIQMGTPAGSINIVPTWPFTQNTNKTWTVTISVFNGAAALELAATNSIGCWLRFRNSIGKP